MRLNWGEDNSVRLAGRTSQDTARIDRTVGNTAISRDFSRAVLLLVIDRGGGFTDRHDKYRPRIARLEMSRFAGLSSSTRCPRSVRSIR
jgi:hypothetical protein